MDYLLSPPHSSNLNVSFNYELMAKRLASKPFKSWEFWISNVSVKMNFQTFCSKVDLNCVVGFCFNFNCYCYISTLIVLCVTSCRVVWMAIFYKNYLDVFYITFMPVFLSLNNCLNLVTTLCRILLDNSYRSFVEIRLKSLIIKFSLSMTLVYF